MIKCTRPTPGCTSSLDHCHYRKPHIFNYCNHSHQINVLLPNHTFHEEIDHNLVWFSETTSLISFDWFLYHEHLHNAKCVMVTSRWKTTIKAMFLCYFYPVLIGIQDHSQTTVLIQMINFNQSGNFIKDHMGSMQIVKILPVNSSFRVQ